MFSKRGLDYLAGALFIALVVTIVVGIVTHIMSVSAETFREDALVVLADIVQDRDLFIVSTAFDLAGNLILIPLAAVLYIVFRSHDRTLALLGSFGFLAAAVLFLMVNMLAISLISLAEDYAGSQIDSILHAARAIGLMMDVAFMMGALGFALGSLSYGLLILTANALPRWIGVFGIAGGIVAPFGWLLFVDTNLVFIGFIGLMIALFFSLISGAWLIWKGSEEAA